MNKIWKFLAKIYCELTLIGFNIAPHKKLFNQPKQKLDWKYSEDILADITFTAKERVNILAGIKDFEDFCNGMIKFSVRFELEPTTLVSDNCSLLLRNAIADPIVAMSDKNFKSQILGLCQVTKSGARLIYLVHERLNNRTIWRTTTSHEFGHYVGMGHTDRPSIMHKLNYGNVLFPTYIDAVEFARIFGCSPEDLKYFKL